MQADQNMHCFLDACMHVADQALRTNTSSSCMQAYRRTPCFLYPCVHLKCRPSTNSHRFFSVHACMKKVHVSLMHAWIWHADPGIMRYKQVFALHEGKEQKTVFLHVCLHLKWGPQHKEQAFFPLACRHKGKSASMQILALRRSNPLSSPLHAGIKPNWVHECIWHAGLLH